MHEKNAKCKTQTNTINEWDEEFVVVERGCDMNDLQNVNMPQAVREELRIKVHLQFF